MPSPWVTRALTSSLPAKALDRTPTESERDSVVAVLLKEGLVNGSIECNDCRATFSYADTAAFVPSDIDGRDFDGEPACPYCGGLL